MKQITVWLMGETKPIIFEGVEDFFENRKALAIIQEDMYIMRTTKIFKDFIVRYTVTDER